MAENKQHVCKSCGNTFTGTYCNLCGEKILDTGDRTFRTFLNNLMITLTVTDRKFLKSLWLTIRRPGFLSKEYAEGRRVNYFKPLQLFLVLNIVYFLFPVLQLFNTSLHTQMYLRTHSPLVKRMVSERIARENISYEAFSFIYNAKSDALAKLLIIVFVILSCLPLSLIYRRKGRHFTDHATLAVELSAYNLAMNAILLSMLLAIATSLFHYTHLGWERYLNDLTLTVIFVMTNLYFLFRAGRSFYGQKNLVLVVKVVLSLLGLFVAFEVYRLILFLITFWTL